MFKRAVLSVALVLSASAAFAAATPAVTESPSDIYARCGVDLSRPNSIVEAAGAACRVIHVISLMEPKEQPATSDDNG